MQPTYFSSFYLGDMLSAKPLGLSDVLAVLERWIFDDAKRSLKKPDDCDFLSNGQFELTDTATIYTRYLDTEDGKFFALRFEHEDFGAHPRRWRTDVVIDFPNAQDAKCRCSVGVYVGNTNSSIAPMGSVVSRPRIVPMMIEELGAYETSKLTSLPIHLKFPDVQNFAAWLESAERILPIVLVTAFNGRAQFSVDINKLASQLCGLAYVCCTSDPRFTYGLADLVGDDHKVYDGGIRCYWPQFSKNDSRFRHKLWTASRVELAEEKAGGFAKQLLTSLGRLSVTRAVQGIARWEDIQKRRMKYEGVQKLDAEELYNSLEEAWDKEQVLTTQVSQLGREVESLEALLDQKESEVTYWREQFSAARIKRAGNSDETPRITDAENLAELLDLVERIFGDRLVIVKQAVRKEAYQFEKIENIAKAFEWLANSYWAAKVGDTPGTDLDLSCRESVGFTFAPNQSELTMSKAPGDYTTEYRGKKYQLEEHIGKGTSTDPRYTIRIAFAFEPAEKIVIVGYVGQHQKTSKSN